MNRTIKIAAVLLAGAGLMGFDSANPWSSLEGEWAYMTPNNCGGANSVTFTNDYPRDRHGEIIRPIIGSAGEPRRTYLATVMDDGRMDYRVAGRDAGTMSEDGMLELTVKHSGIWPFNGFSHVTLRVVDDNTLQEVSADGDGDRLMRALGGAPVGLVRCITTSE